MAISNINTIINDDIHKVWDIVFAVDKYSEWRSDLSKTEIINDKQFIEYTKDGYASARWYRSPPRRQISPSRFSVRQRLGWPAYRGKNPHSTGGNLMWCSMC